MVEHKIVKGISIIYKREVNATDTATYTSHGALDNLLSMPAIISMVIEASIKLLDPLLPESYLTVGGRIEMIHEKPTLIGESVNLVVTVEEVQGNRIRLDVAVHDPVGVIARGKHDRFIVKGDELMESAYNRLGHNLE